MQPYVRSIISSYEAQFIQDVSTRAARVGVFTRPRPRTDITKGPLALPHLRIHGINAAKRDRFNDLPALGVPYRSQSLKATKQEQELS